jgi:hypothetical protein
MSAMSVLEKKEERKRLKREQKRLKERTKPKERQSLNWSERLSLPSWFPSFKWEQWATDAKIPPSGIIGNTSKSTLAESFHEPDELHMYM